MQLSENYAANTEIMNGFLALSLGESVSVVYVEVRMVVLDTVAG